MPLFNYYVDTRERVVKGKFIKGWWSPKCRNKN
jgi:hypothetical protein